MQKHARNQQCHATSLNKTGQVDTHPGQIQPDVGRRQNDTHLSLSALVSEKEKAPNLLKLLPMSPKAGTWLFVLAVACSVVATVCPAETSNVMSVDDVVFIGKKLLWIMMVTGYPAPSATLMSSVFNSSVLTAGGKPADQSNSLLSTFLPVLNSLTAATSKNPPGQIPVEALEKMKSNMWNCSYLPAMIRTIRNSSEQVKCYMEAFVAPLSWATAASPSTSTFSSADYDTLLSAARSVLLDVSSAVMNLPATIDGQKLKQMMITLRSVYSTLNEDQRAEVLNWAREQIVQNNFSCTLKKTPNSKPKPLASCKPTVKWLDSDALNMIGPFLSSLQPTDVDASPQGTLCAYFTSGQFSSSVSGVTRMNPSLAKMLLQSFQQCFSPNEFQKYLDKLGPLACYYSASNLTSDLSKKLLSQLTSCDSSITSKLEKALIKNVLSGPITAQALRDLGRNVALVPPKQLATLSSADVKDLLQNPGVEWSRSQMFTLVKKQLGGKKCGEVLGADVMALQSVAAGLPSCALKKLKAQDVLANTEALRNMSKQMNKGQLKAVLEGLGGNASLSDLMEKLPGPLLRCVSLTNLKKANITSLDQVENKTWSVSQAAYLAKKMRELNKVNFRRLKSVLQGVTCKMIAEVNDSQLLETVQALAETPQWLSKTQVRCAAGRLFKSLEQKRSDYFRNITEQELAAIPNLLLLYMTPEKVKDLPDSVCQAFLDKMAAADLNSLPLNAPSRLALTQRALLCLTIGKNLSELTKADVLRLGPILCETPPSRLALMAPDVIQFSLQAMASCQSIPQLHRPDLVRLVTQTFGSPSNWTAALVESVGPLILLDDNATSALPNAPWMKDSLAFLKLNLIRMSDAFRKKYFEVATAAASSSARRRRAANSTTAPTAALIEELGLDNVLWTASQLDGMSDGTFLAAVDTLGSVPGYSPDQLVVLSKKAVQVFGPVSQMNESAVVQLRCIAQGFSNADLAGLPLPLDSLDEVALCGWKDSQIPSVWRAVAKYNNLTASLLDSTAMVTLNRFFCGLSSGEISQLSVNAFREAVGSMDNLPCPLDVLQQLKQLAVSSFGSPDTWTEALVSDLRNITAGLNANEAASLDPSVFSFLNQASIPLFPPQVFAALSPAQLENLGPDNAAMVTSGQRAALTPEQLRVVNRLATGSADSQAPPQSSAAPALRVEAVFSALFLLIGLLLL
ncbi:transcript variant X1 [Nothobranchius furzeri]|uniref:Transcript variant X1 n=2 Tax=Nothobranchius furzeri TaxID=105023 RepID=A0A9D3BY90_NOTFU|nr:transcript variant X1 [Nothobranchius furzeri]